MVTIPTSRITELGLQVYLTWFLFPTLAGTKPELKAGKLQSDIRLSCSPVIDSLSRTFISPARVGDGCGFKKLCGHNHPALNDLTSKLPPRTRRFYHEIIKEE